MNDHALANDSDGIEAQYALLCSGIKLNNWLIKKDFSDKRQYVRELMVEHIPIFSYKNRTLIVNYLANHVSLNQICKQWIDYLKSLGTFFNAIKLYQGLTDYSAHVDKTIKGILQKRTFKHQLNILGFGLLNGSYEKKISNFLIEVGLTEEVKLYGFDPHATEPMQIPIIGLNKETLHNLAQQKNQFDIILARWVLHHVPPHERWQDLIAALNATAEGADTIIIEESWFPNENTARSLSFLFQELILGLLDVLVNFTLHPDWLMLNPNSFYLQYLRPHDLHWINSKIKRQNRQDIHTLAHPLLNQFVIHSKFS